MIPVEPVAYEGSMGVTYAKDQPQYTMLPARVFDDSSVLTEWEPTAEELEYLLQGGKVRLWIYCGFDEQGVMRKLQPVSLEVVVPECGLRNG